MTTLLLTGGTGFAGSHFLDYALIATDWQFIVVRGAHVHSPPWRGARHEHSPRVRLVARDLTQPFTAAEAGALGPVDYMACYASAAEPAESIASPAPFIRANTDIALVTLELARLLEPERVAWVSTAEALGPVLSGHPGHEEFSGHAPLSPYAAGKAAQEDIALAYAASYGVPVTIARTQNLFGERQHPAKLVPALMRKLLADEPVTIIADQGEPGTRRFLHAGSLAEAVLFLLRREEGAPLAVNIAGKRLSTLEVARAVAKCLGKPLSYELLAASRPGHEGHYALDTSRMTAMGWQPSVPFAEALERTVAWTRERPEWLYP